MIYKITLNEDNSIYSVIVSDFGPLENEIEITEEDYKIYRDKEDSNIAFYIDGKVELKEKVLSDYEIKLKDIAESKSYLAETDWIVTKIAEADIEGRDTTDLKAKYIDKLSHRKLMREVINSAESE